MAIEIERKYRIVQAHWENLSKPEGTLYRQGYLSVDPARVIRIRIAGAEAFLTVKGTTAGISRTEIECNIALNAATEMLDHFALSEILKIRYHIPYAGKVWEVDVFLGKNNGLIIAELELESEEEPIDIPEWVGEEVTHDYRYSNACLSLHPYHTWQTL